MKSWCGGNTKIKKIHILGGPGSGKTYLTKQLSEKLNVRGYDLDDLFWDNKAETFGIKSDPKIRDNNLGKILKKKTWIIEGVYGDWTRPSFKSADLIIILQLNNIIRTIRILKRFIMRKLGIEPSKKKETFKEFFGLIKWSWRYYKKNFPGIYKQLQPYKEKTKFIKKARFKIEDYKGNLEEKELR